MTHDTLPKTLDGTSVTIVGAGFGGLSTGCYLADAGAEVTVLEKNDQVGGRASTLEREGFRFDMGPSWYLMPDVFERFFGAFDRQPAEFYDLQRLDPHYRIFWKDGDSVTVGADLSENKQRFESYEEGAGEALEEYLDFSEYTYNVGMEQFVYTDRTRYRDFLDLDVLRHARGLPLLGSMQEHAESYFENPKLQQLVQYTLVFLGGAPTNTPALYNLMSHVDFNMGVYYPDGGMAAVVDGIAELGAELGVSYETGQPVTAIEQTGQSLGVTTEHNRTVNSDVVVSNADYVHTEQELLSDEDRHYSDSYWESRTYAPSAYLLYLGVEGDVEPLAHHSLVLPTNWSQHFDQIFEEPAWPNDPAYYLCVPSRTDDAVAPEGHSNLFALVPIAPGLDDSADHRADMRDTILADIAANTGVDLRDRIVFEHDFCVSDFASRYNSYQGTALGLAHTLRQTSLFRPDRASSDLDGLYYTGSYTTPGIGVPMCLISGEHTARKVANDY